MPKVAISMLTCNEKAWTEATLLTLLSSDIMSFNPHICIVDNNSTDGTLDLLRGIQALFTSVDVIRNPVNVGIITARNQSYWKIVGTDPSVDYIIEIHNDMLFPKNWSVELVKAMDNDPEMALMCSHIITSRKWKPEVTGMRLGDLIEQVNERCSAESNGDVRHINTFEFNHPDIFRVNFYKQTNFHDDNILFQNYEDLDFFIRALKAGKKVGYHEGVCVFHYGEMSRKKYTNPLENKNGPYMMSKWPDMRKYLHHW